MTESPTHSAKRFGWVQPKPELGDWHLHSTIRTADLSSEAWKEFKEVIAVLAHLRPYVIDFVSVLKDYKELVQLEAALETEAASWLQRFDVTATPALMNYATAQRALSNFLSGASAFRDRARIRLIADFGKESAECAAFKGAVTAAFDSSLAYRLCYYLRNVAQHHDSPLQLLPMKGDRGEDGKMVVTVRVELQRDLLLAIAKPLVKKGKLSKRFVSDLEAQPTTFPVLPLATDYTRQLGHIFKTTVDFRTEKLTRYEDYIRHIVTSSGMPPNAVPLIFDGPLPPIGMSGVSMKPLLYSFSIEEFDFLTRLIEQICAGRVPDLSLGDALRASADPLESPILSG